MLRRSVVPRRPVAAAGTLCVTAGLVALGVPRVRVAGPLAFIPLGAIVVWSLTLAVLASRLWDLAPPERRPAVVRHVTRIIALALVNLVLLDVVAHVVIFAVRVVGSHRPIGVAAVIALVESERVVAVTVYRLLALVALLGTILLVVRGLAAIVRLTGLGDLVARTTVGAVTALVVVESWYTLALSVAALLPLPTVVHHTTVVSVGTVHVPPGLATPTALTLRSWTSTGGVVHVLAREGDELVPERLSPAQPVVVKTRPLGSTGLALVQHVGVDHEAGVPALVAAMPSAEWPRKWLIGALVREGRWDEAVGQLREYRRYYPGDDDVVRRVAYSLREGRQTTLARAVEGEFLR